MILQPCHTCHLKGQCPTEAEKRKMLYGSKLSSAKFRCNILLASLCPGRVVTAALEYVWDGQTRGYDDDAPTTKPGTLTGVVMGRSKGKIRVFFDDQDGGCLYSWRVGKKVNVVRLRPNQLQPTGRIVSVCRVCGMPAEAKNEMEEWQCGEGGCAWFTEAAH